LPSEKPWLRLADIAENARQILEYTHGMTLADFIGDRRTSDASERCMMRIAEAAAKLGSVAEERFPSYDWKSIRGMGNVLRHDYDQVSLPMIWDSINKSLAPLAEEVESALAVHDAGKE
jgi:uncharacterized protein with HEPN domain